MSSAGTHVRRAASFWGTADTTLRVDSMGVTHRDFRGGTRRFVGGCGTGVGTR